MSISVIEYLRHMIDEALFLETTCGGLKEEEFLENAGSRHRTSNTGHRRADRTALFVGRIYPVRGLPLLVEAWARIRPAGWKIKVVGPDEAD